MSQIDHVFVDLDGVLADFTRAALRAHGCEHLMQAWPEGESDVAKVMGISRTQFWDRIDGLGASFWKGLEPYPWFASLIEYVGSVAPFTLLTAPTLSPDCTSGKIAWIYQHFPKEKGRRFTNFLIGHRKHLLAAPGRVLIDDSEENVAAFQASGGLGVLFPQAWNRLHSISEPSAFVQQAIDAYRSGIGRLDVS